MDEIKNLVNRLRKYEEEYISINRKKTVVSEFHNDLIQYSLKLGTKINLLRSKISNIEMKFTEEENKLLEDTEFISYGKVLRELLEDGYIDEEKIDQTLKEVQKIINEKDTMTHIEFYNKLKKIEQDVHKTSLLPVIHNFQKILSRAEKEI